MPSGTQAADADGVGVVPCLDQKQYVNTVISPNLEWIVHLIVELLSRRPSADGMLKQPKFVRRSDVLLRRCLRTIVVDRKEKNHLYFVRNFDKFKRTVVSFGRQQAHFVEDWRNSVIRS